MQRLIDRYMDILNKHLLNLQLHAAACDGHTQALQELLAAGADANSADEEGWTPLMIAAQGGHLEVMRALLAAGADTNMQKEGGWTALMSAVQQGHTEATRLLLGAGADVAAALPQYCFIIFIII